jgi:hypothetical protein
MASNKVIAMWTATIEEQAVRIGLTLSSSASWRRAKVDELLMLAVTWPATCLALFANSFGETARLGRLCWVMLAAGVRSMSEAMGEVSDLGSEGEDTGSSSLLGA